MSPYWDKREEGGVTINIKVTPSIPLNPRGMYSTILFAHNYKKCDNKMEHGVKEWKNNGLIPIYLLIVCVVKLSEAGKGN
jgi:hypothetical protein